jgi:hypothetical protein
MTYKKLIANQLLNRWYKELGTLSPMSIVSGFILSDGRVLNIESWQHKKFINEFDKFIVGNNALLEEEGAIRVRIQSEVVYVEVYRKPTKKQLEVLMSVGAVQKVHYDFIMGSSNKSNDEPINRRLFIKELKNFWK